jgi:hypothetical protein
LGLARHLAAQAGQSTKYGREAASTLALAAGVLDRLRSDILESEGSKLLHGANLVDLGSVEQWWTRL